MLIFVVTIGERALAKNIPNNEMYEKISEWLDTYHSTDSDRKKANLKTLIVSQMIPVVKNIAKTIARRATDPIEDLVQAGFIGLLKAIDNYSKEKNDNFRVYAGYLIIGEMKHFLRDQLNTIRVPRHIQELCIRINNFTQTLTQEELQNITSADVATALSVPQETIDFALQADRRCSTLSLEDVFKTENEQLSYEEILTYENYEEKAEFNDARIIFNEIIQLLSTEEIALINMYYKQDMSQKEIADALQVSQMSISRKMKKTFNFIARAIEEKRI